MIFSSILRDALKQRVAELKALISLLWSLYGAPAKDKSVAQRYQ
jgi:hypothetical protein